MFVTPIRFGAVLRFVLLLLTTLTIFSLGAPRPALADCVLSGVVVTCSGNSPGGFAAGPGVTGLTVNVLQVATRYPDRVFNYFDGKCYVTASPLLGATSEGGEFLTLLADELIAAGTYRGVIIVAAAHDGSPVSRWRRNGDLNERLLSTLKALPPGYKVTEVVWHQGRAHDACRSLHGVVQLADRDPDGKRCGRPRLRRDRQQAHLPRRRNGRAPRPGRPARGQMPSQRKRADKDGCGLCAGHQGVSPVTLTLSGELFEARGDAPRAAWDTGLGAGTDDESVGRPKSRSGTAAI